MSGGQIIDVHRDIDGVALIVTWEYPVNIDDRVSGDTAEVTTTTRTDRIADAQMVADGDPALAGDRGHAMTTPTMRQIAATAYALANCNARRFREYEASHLAKVAAYGPFRQEAHDAQIKAERNADMAAMNEELAALFRLAWEHADDGQVDTEFLFGGMAALRKGES